MASFTDSIPKYNPYISQVPYELMAKVGMAKQQQYEQGIQKIQSTIDNVAGLDIYKDVDKQYLQSKLNQLGNDLKWVGASDFSDFQLVNSVNGMTNQLVKDKNVLNAVSSTAFAKKEMAFMEEERKKGKTSPSNEAVFNEKLNSWANDGKVGSSFSGKYDPYFDVWKYAKDTFDALGDESMSFDQIYQTDPATKRPLLDKNNKPILSNHMVRMIKEGKFPEKVKVTLNQIFSDPRVGKQLSIDGQYNLSGLDETALKQKIQLKKENDLSSYEDRLFDLQMAKSFGKDVSGEIDNVKDSITKINTSYDDLLGSSDLKAIRGTLYKQDTYDRYTGMFTKIKVTEQILDNPAAKFEFDLNKEAQRRSEKAFDQNLEVLKYKRGILESDRDYELNVFKAQTEANKKGGASKNNNTGGGDGGGGTNRPEDTTRQFVAMADEKYTNAANSYSSAQDKFIWETMFKSPANEETIKQIMKDAPGDTPLSQGAAIGLFLKLQAKKDKESNGDISVFRTKWALLGKERMNNTADKTKINPVIKDIYDNTLATRKVFDLENSNRIEREKDAVKTVESLGLDEDFANIQPETVTYRGQKVTLSKQNQIDIATYIAGKHNIVPMGANVSKDIANQAKKRLDNQGLGDIAERYLQSSRVADIPANPISGAVGVVANIGSGIVDLLSEGETNVNSYDKMAKMFKLTNAIADKSYGKVVDRQAKIIKGQYEINPNKGFTLSTGNTEDDRYLKGQLSTFVSAFTRDGDNQNLATDTEFEAFQENLISPATEKDIYYTITSESDGTGKPVWAVVDNNGGRMVLNSDQAIELNYNPNDIYESNNVMYLRNKLNQNLGKTSIGNPGDISTYKSNNNDYQYDTSAGDFPAITNPNYTVRANVLENRDQEGKVKYYPYIFMDNGIDPPKVVPLSPEDNLSKVDAAIRTINNVDVKSVLK